MTRKIINITLLVFGFILSSLVIVRFSIEDFQFIIKRISILPHLSFIDIGIITPNVDLTSRILGYTLFLILGFRFVRKISNLKLRNAALVFKIVCLISVIVEVICIVTDIYRVFQGTHFIIGLPLFLFGLIIYLLDIVNKKQ